MSDYWSPEQKGEFKRVLFDRIENTQIVDQGTGEIIELPCAFFWTTVDGSLKMIRNGSKRLVGQLHAFNLKNNTPLIIKYLGKTTNKTNAFKSDDWSVKQLIINAAG